MRSFNSVARRSEARKGGEPLSHVQASNSIYQFVHKKYGIKYMVFPGYEEFFDSAFIREHKLRESGRTFMGHEYDLMIGCYKKLNVVEWKPGENMKNSYETKQIYKFTPDIFVEIGDIGDDTKHNPGHKSQLINDGIGRSWVEYQYPQAKYVKINKDDCAYESVLEEKLASLNV